MNLANPPKLIPYSISQRAPSLITLLSIRFLPKFDSIYRQMADYKGDLFNASPKRSSARGVAAIELALFIPIFILFVVAAFDIGRILYTRYNIVRAAYEGVRYGMRLEAPINANLIRTRITTLLNRKNIQLAPDKINIGIETNKIEFNPDKTDLITVQISYPFRYLFSFMGSKEIVANTSSSAIRLD